MAAQTLSVSLAPAVRPSGSLSADQRPYGTLAAATRPNTDGFDRTYDFSIPPNLKTFGGDLIIAFDGSAVIPF